LDNVLIVISGACIPAVGRKGVLAGDARQNDTTTAKTLIDLVVQRITAIHMHDVQPARVAEIAQLAIECLDLRQLVPLVRDEHVWIGRLYKRRQ